MHRVFFVCPYFVSRYLTKTAEKVAALGDVKYMIVTARESADGEVASP